MKNAASRFRRPLRANPLCLEALEDRCLLSGSVLQTNLVSDLPGVANVTDVNLVNPWGISASPTGPFWISDSGASTLYNTPGRPQPLVVSIPTPGNPMGAASAPTGTVFNIAYANKGFLISDGVRTLPATFLFATTDGTIAGWNAKIDPTGKFAGLGGSSTRAVIATDYSTSLNTAYKADYRGLTIATDAGGQTYLYAANARTGRIDVFDSTFQRAALTAGAFTDPDMPKTYAPFNVQAIGDRIYVTYAKRKYTSNDTSANPGNGFVDVFHLDGSGGRRLVSRGPLDSPWGLAIAPAAFGSLAGGLMVGNFGNGRINLFDPQSGDFLGALKDADGVPIEIDGLWALKVGNGYSGGDANTIYFTAGLDHERHGLFGALTATAPKNIYVPDPVEPSAAEAPAPAALDCDTPNMTAAPAAPSTPDQPPEAPLPPTTAHVADTPPIAPMEVAAPSPTPVVIAECAPPANQQGGDQTDAADNSISYPYASSTHEDYRSSASSAPLTSYPSTYEVTSYVLAPAGLGHGYYQYYAADADSVASSQGSETVKAPTKTALDTAGPLRPHVVDAPSLRPPARMSGLAAAVVSLVAGAGVVPSPMETGTHAAAAPTETLRDEPLPPERDRTSWLASNLANLEGSPGKKAEELVEAVGSSEEIFRPGPQLGGLAGGALTIDLANLKRAIDRFFARLEDLADDLTLPHTQMLAQWLLAGAAATGMFEFIRRGSKPATERGDSDESLWTPYPSLAISPPED